jgi:zinc/manganese transport system substrate-binding protein
MILRHYRLLISVLLVLALVLPNLSAVAAGKLKVITATEDLASIVREVGGDKVEVFSISQGNQNPHFVPPKPSYMLKLKNADLLVRTGMELDIWLDPLIEGSRNTRIFRNGPGYVDASLGLHALGPAASKIDRSMGDVHPYGNPHYWLDPVNAKSISLNVVNGLKRVDPADATYFDQRRMIFLKGLAARLTGWINEAKPLSGVPIITYHDQWPYFQQRFGIKVVGHLEPLPGIPPSPKSLAQLIEQAKKEHVKLIITAPYYNQGPALTVARATGAKVVQVPTSVTASAGVTSYFQLFDTIIGALVKNL